VSSVDEVSVERRALVRAANQRIADAARELAFDGKLPLLCECGDPGCGGFARVDADGFDVVATQPSWLITGDAHGHRYAVRDAETGNGVLLGAE
jgi:hypothetical protein